MRKSGWFVTGSAWGVYAFLYLPLLCVALSSFNASRNSLVWGGFSLAWYQKLSSNEMVLHAARNTLVLAVVSTLISTVLGTLAWYQKLSSNEMVLHAARNTLVLAVVSTLISTVLGTLLALGIHHIPWGRRSNRFMEALLNLPVVTPDIIFAVALVIAFGAIRSLTGLFQLGMPTMIVGHVAFQIAFVALVVRSRLEAIGVDLEEAAFDLYASYPRLLWTVVLPLLRPGIFAGAALAFTLSLDDFIISFFTSGPESMTLPLFIYAAVRRGVTPEIHALSTLVMVLTVVVVMLMQRFTARSEAEIQA